MAADDLTVRLQALEERLMRLERAVLGPELRARSAPAPHTPTEAAAPATRPASPATPPAAASRAATPAATPAASSAATPAAAVAPQTAAPRPAPPRRTAPPVSSADADANTITTLLGWSGAVALVLAAAYLIRLAIDAGWLTPPVQVGGAALFGVALIVAGFALTRTARDYASLLPAAGIAVLFLSVYGAHLLYHLMGAGEAGVAVTVVCALSIGLCIAFDSDLYALFAVAGSYSAPFLLAGRSGTAGDLAVYFSAWSLTFTVLSIVRGRRAIYLLALYIALIGFDAVARPRGFDWHVVLTFQSVQFLIFGVGAVVFAARSGEPMDQGTAVAHLPALLLFYALQYTVLREHLPQQAPWIAIGTLLAVALLYLGARAVLGRPSPGGALLLGSYAALVLFHACYLELVPATAAPWVAIGFAAALLALRERASAAGGALRPLLIVVGAIFVINLLRALNGGAELRGVPAQQWLAPCYAAMLYLGYAASRNEPPLARFAGVLLYAGHLTAMAAIVRLIHEPILQSVTWGLLALACLGASLAQRERLLGQSSLLLFGLTALKVMASDLSGAAPLARIVSLVVLGVTFYVAGLLYRRMSQAVAAAA